MSEAGNARTVKIHLLRVTHILKGCPVVILECLVRRQKNVGFERQDRSLPTRRRGECHGMDNNNLKKIQ